MHLNSVTEGLQVGSKVPEGTQIGTIGRSGNGSLTGYTPHLQYELNIDGQRVNPATSPTGLIDPQTRITPTVLPEVTVTGQAPTPQPPQVNVPEVRLPEIRVPEERR